MNRICGISGVAGQGRAKWGGLCGFGWFCERVREKNLEPWPWKRVHGEPFALFQFRNKRWREREIRKRETEREQTRKSRRERER